MPGWGVGKGEREITPLQPPNWLGHHLRIALPVIFSRSLISVPRSLLPNLLVLVKCSCFSAQPGLVCPGLKPGTRTPELVAGLEPPSQPVAEALHRHLNVGFFFIHQKAWTSFSNTVSVAPTRLLLFRLVKKASELNEREEAASSLWVLGSRSR